MYCRAVSASVEHIFATSSLTYMRLCVSTTTKREYSPARRIWMFGGCLLTIIYEMWNHLAYPDGDIVFARDDGRYRTDLLIRAEHSTNVSVNIYIRICLVAAVYLFWQWNIILCASERTFSCNRNASRTCMVNIWKSCASSWRNTSQQCLWLTIISVKRWPTLSSSRIALTRNIDTSTYAYFIFFGETYKNSSAIAMLSDCSDTDKIIIVKLLQMKKREEQSTIFLWLPQLISRQ